MKIAFNEKYKTPEGERAFRLFSIWCSSRVKHLVTDDLFINSLDDLKRYANGSIFFDQNKLTELRLNMKNIIRDFSAYTVLKNAAWAINNEKIDINKDLAKGVAMLAIFSCADLDTSIAAQDASEAAANALEFSVGFGKDESNYQNIEFKRMINCLDTGKQYEIENI